ncbi:SdpI family protein [Rhodococcus sp. BP-349]|uniref:SdpI family protein n=1 Tax=unclassified Rhodococcus (in: high G+C Gram-positive bacteria) TaxID=192944 RepID=UPI001C9B6284|nr:MULTISPECIES: SdpI family protein [unclassified Rhodococcus (in: high G+C Gram-positive bacteria)]MBY6539330.1 SdpI family protein [Rhodococcus sp. BP-363]MBY6544342.1 SdpI family protein [Rhodococcus sp. BP-369]MBY6563572.1 SdpI family protein [Rhodococcus sp. BP-370]MBY6577864.1 SdpI family protein [Rhodococcus sp. BP-364]MBY6587165.1 SdpI family protein [Rhodococcus sp. BP-358]
MEPAPVLSLLVGVVLLGSLSWVMRKQGANVDVNSAVGLRTKATMASRDAWRAGHRAAAAHLLAVGVTAVVVVGVTTTLWLIASLTEADIGPAVVSVPAVGLAVQAVVLVAATVRADRVAERHA